MAADGFAALGYSVDRFSDDDFESIELDDSTLVVAGVTTFLAALARRGVSKEFDSIPTQLLPFSRRRI